MQKTTLGRHRSALAIALLLIGVGFMAPLHAVQGGAMSGSVRGVPSPPVDSPPAAPRLVPLSEFVTMPAEERRKVLTAWKARPPRAPSQAFASLLIAAISDDDIQVRVTALRAYEAHEGALALARMRGHAVNPDADANLTGVRKEVLNALNDLQPRVRTAAASALRGLAFIEPEKVEPALQRHLTVEENPTVMAELVAALGDAARGGSRTARDSVIKALSNMWPEVQARAAEAARRIPAPETLPKLLTLLDSSESRVRAAAADGIGVLQRADGARYIAVLRDYAAKELNPAVQKALQRAIEKVDRRQGR